MYQILTTIVENDNEDAILEGEILAQDQIEFSFEKGVSVSPEGIKNPIEFEFYENTLRGTMTDHLYIDTIRGPVFSLKTRNLFEKIGIKNIEFYQVTLRDEFPEGQSGNHKKDDEKKKTIEYIDYFIANVVGLVDCVDHEKSTLEYFYPPELRNQETEISVQGGDDYKDPFADENQNEIDFITKLVFDESKIDPKLKGFRLKDQPDLLVFHESVVDSIRKENLTGFVFVPVSEYTDAIQDDNEEEDAIKGEDEKKQDQKTTNPKSASIEKSTEPDQKETQKPAAKSRFGFSV